jgi:hypothetical protein
MELFFKAIAALKGWRTYIASGFTLAVSVVYLLTTWDIIGFAGMVGISAQAAALRAAINDFKKGVDEKLFGSD